MHFMLWPAKAAVVLRAEFLSQPRLIWFRGQFVLDEQVLASQGLSSFSRYSLDSGPLLPGMLDVCGYLRVCDISADLFVEDKIDGALRMDQVLMQSVSQL